MFSTSILDVAVGVVFTFLAVSVVASAITEAIASNRKWRQTMLLDGVKALLNADVTEAGAEFVVGLYNSALISHFGAGDATRLPEIKALPAYIEPKAFSTTLLSLVRARHAPEGTIPDAIDSMDDGQIKSALKALSDRAGKDEEKMHDAVASWFGAAMDRLSGRYKRNTQVWTFFIALAVAAALNADAMRVTRTIWSQKPKDAVLEFSLDKQVLAKCSEQERDDDCANRRVGKMVELLGSSGGLIGWEKADLDAFKADPGPALAGNVLVLLLGFLISAGAALFGAPFWFDALQRIVQIRGTGPTPKEAAADSQN